MRATHKVFGKEEEIMQSYKNTFNVDALAARTCLWLSNKRKKLIHDFFFEFTNWLLEKKKNADWDVFSLQHFPVCYFQLKFIKYCRWFHKRKSTTNPKHPRNRNFCDKSALNGRTLPMKIADFEGRVVKFESHHVNVALSFIYIKTQEQ